MPEIASEYRALDDLRPHPRNPNLHTRPGVIEKMAQRIRHVAFTAPIICNPDGLILGGHLRRLGLLKLRADSYPEPVGVQPGWQVPVRVFRGTQVQETQIVLADNPDPADDELDRAALASLLSDLAALGELPGAGYDEARLQELIDGLSEALEAEGGASGLLPDADPDSVPENAPTRCQTGDLWRLGAHRLLCGDSTDPEQVARLMGGRRAAMVFADPPYGVEYQSGMSQGGTATRFDRLANDGTILPVAPAAMSLLADDGAAFIWACHQTYPEWREQFAKWYKHTIIWHKPGGGIGDLAGNYATDYEMCLFCTKGRPLFRGKRGLAVWTVAKDGVNDYQHPTQKPVELAARAMLDFSDPGGVIWDGYLGSGTTIIAAEANGRTCYGAELDPKFGDIILSRWEQATGRTAELLDRANG